MWFLAKHIRTTMKQYVWICVRFWHISTWSFCSYVWSHVETLKICWSNDSHSQCVHTKQLLLLAFILIHLYTLCQSEKEESLVPLQGSSLCNLIEFFLGTIIFGLFIRDLNLHPNFVILLCAKQYLSLKAPYIFFKEKKTELS